jgi:hypothetical protein
MIDYVPSPKFKARAALFFLEGGHYLFRDCGANQESSKFVTSIDVAAAFSRQEIDTGWLPAGIVRYGHNAKGPWFVYSPPAQKVQVIIGDDHVAIPIPRTVLVGNGAMYYLMALKGKHFEHQADGYHAPFPNVYIDGRICWGQNTPPEAWPEHARQVWDLFFSTPFNGDLANGKSKQEKTDVRVLLRELGKANRYPENDLVEINTTIGYAIERLVK